MGFCPGDSSVIRSGSRLGPHHRMRGHAEHLLQPHLDPRRLAVIVDRHPAPQRGVETAPAPAGPARPAAPRSAGAFSGSVRSSARRSASVRALARCGSSQSLGAASSAASLHLRPALAPRQRDPRPQTAGRPGSRAGPAARNPSNAARAIASGGASQGRSASTSAPNRSCRRATHPALAPRPFADVTPARSGRRKARAPRPRLIATACRTRASRASPSRSVATISRAPAKRRAGGHHRPLAARQHPARRIALAAQPDPVGIGQRRHLGQLSARLRPVARPARKPPRLVA